MYAAHSLIYHKYWVSKTCSSFTVCFSFFFNVMSAIGWMGGCWFVSLVFSFFFFLAENAEGYKHTYRHTSKWWNKTWKITIHKDTCTQQAGRDFRCPLSTNTEAVSISGSGMCRNEDEWIFTPTHNNYFMRKRRRSDQTENNIQHILNEIEIRLCLPMLFFFLFTWLPYMVHMRRKYIFGSQQKEIGEKKEWLSSRHSFWPHIRRYRTFGVFRFYFSSRENI